MEDRKTIGMSELAPILPLYIRYLGIQNSSLVSQLSGITFGCTYLITAVFSPIWGYAADKVGRKPMILRAGIGLSIVYLLMGFVPNIYFLIVLCAVQGAITGYGTACNTLIATQTDREHVGYALGTHIISAPRLGKLSDKIGAHKVIMISLIVAGVLYMPQAFVQNPWQLLVLRFLLGFAMGGLIPSVSIMIKKITPDNLTGRIFGFNMSLGYLGVATGSVLGGQIAGRFSFQYVFYVIWDIC